jgi:hypothetical protein
MRRSVGSENGLPKNMIPIGSRAGMGPARRVPPTRLDGTSIDVHAGRWEETAQLLLKLGAGTLEKTGVVVVLQRSGDLNLGNRAPQ